MFKMLSKYYNKCLKMFGWSFYFVNFFDVLFGLYFLCYKNKGFGFDKGILWVCIFIFI